MNSYSATIRVQLATLVTVLIVAVPSAGTAAMEKQKRILNEDDSHFFGSRSAEQMSLPSST